jgi:hypothetical protein
MKLILTTVADLAVLLAIYQQEDQAKEATMGRTFSKHENNAKCIQKLQTENRKGRYQF